MGSKIIETNHNKNKNNEQFYNDKKCEIIITKDSYVYLVQDNTFIVFKSINDILYLVYSNENKSIIFYNLIDFKKIIELKNAHINYITNFRYYLDKINKRDLLLSISAQDNNIKLWDINCFECIINIVKIYSEGILSSGVIFNENNINYIIVCNFNVWDSDSIKIFDFNGNKIKEIKDNANDKTFLIDIYYDTISSKNYILTGNWGYIKSYDYNKNKIYHKYCDNDKKTHYNIIINEKDKDKLIKLIEAGGDGNVRIWDFHRGLLVNKINVCENGLRNICLWDNEYLFVGCHDSIKLIDLRENIIIKNINCQNYQINSIKKINHPKYGECLISQGLKNDQIKLWIFKV